MSSIEMITFLPTEEELKKISKKPKTVKLGSNTFLWLTSLALLDNVYPTTQDEIIFNDESYKVIHYIYDTNRGDRDKGVTTYLLTIKKK